MTIQTSSDQTKQATTEKYLKTKSRCLRIWALIGIAILVVLAVKMLGVINIAVAIVMWTAVLVFCLRGIVNGLEKRGINRIVGTAISYVILFVSLILILLLVFSPALGLGKQFTSFLDNVPSYIDMAKDWINVLYNQYASVLQNDTVQGWVNDALAAASNQVTELAKSSANNLVSIGSGLVNTGMSIAFALVISFWLLIDLPRLGTEFRKLFSSKYQEDLDILHVTLTRVMGGYIKATAIQCTLIGVLSGIWFAIMQVPNAAALGCITGILNVIPVVGPWIGGIIAALVMLFVNPLSALIVFIGAAVAQQFVYTFISPRIMSDSVDVHPAFTFIALMIGSAVGNLMGGLIGAIIGMLLSIPITAVIKSLFVYYFEKKTGRQLVSENGVFFKGTPNNTEDEQINPFKDAISPHPGSTTSVQLLNDSLRKKIQTQKEAKQDKKKAAAGAASAEPPKEEPADPEPGVAPSEDELTEIAVVEYTSTEMTISKPKQ